MKQYLDLVTHVVEKELKADRTGTGLKVCLDTKCDLI